MLDTLTGIRSALENLTVIAFEIFGRKTKKSYAKIVLKSTFIVSYCN
jgi:hypothetical protein